MIGGWQAQRSQAWQLASFFVTQQLETVPLEIHETGTGKKAGVARAWEIHTQVVDKTTWAWAHHQDAIGKEQRLVDVVSDEYHGRADACPDVQQQLLHA